MKSTSLILSLLLMAGVAFGQKNNYKAPVLTDKYMKDLGLAKKPFTQKAEGVWTAGNITIYSSHPYGDDIKGFKGSTPLFIAVDKRGNILTVAPAANMETPDFWNRVLASKLLQSWRGLTLQQAATLKVDAVTGATYSSVAVIKTVQATAKNVK